MRSSNFEKFITSYGNKEIMVDLRSFAQKACDYIKHLAEVAGAENEKFVQNALNLIQRFSYKCSFIEQQVWMVEHRLSRRINEKQRENGILPGLEVFRNGVISTGIILGTNIEAKLTIEQFSGNMVIYGQYGMGKTNYTLHILPQLIALGIHVDIFDLAADFRDLLPIPECSGGLVLNTNTDMLNPLAPIGSPDEHLQFFWEITKQDYNLRDETKEMLFNYSVQLYRDFGVYEGNDPPTLFDLRRHLISEKGKNISNANKSKIRTALEKLDYILASFGKMADCSRGYSLNQLDKFSFVSYEIGNLSEDKRSWFMKLKLKQYFHKGMLEKERHKVKRIIAIDEAKGIVGKSRIGEATNYIKDMFTRSRSIGCWWIISDQFSSELSDFVRAASCQNCFQHTVPREIREITASMGGDESLRQEIPRLGRHRLFQKITDFPFPYIVIPPKARVNRHISDAELNKLQKGRLSMLAYDRAGRKETAKVRVVSSQSIKHSAVIPPEPKKRVISQANKNPLDDLEKFLRYIQQNPEAKVTDVYKALKFSGRKGNDVKEKAKENQLITETIDRQERKGRPSLTLALTEKGRQYIEKRCP